MRTFDADALKAHRLARRPAAWEEHHRRILAVAVHRD
jgi:hypothetical protein